MRISYILRPNLNKQKWVLKMKKVLISVFLIVTLIEVACEKKQSEQTQTANKKQLVVDTAYSNFLPSVDGQKFNMLVLTIPIDKQPYPTPAYHHWNSDGTLIILVSGKNWKYNCCLQEHEMVEAALCIKDRIHLADIIAFDKQWKHIPGSGIEEPGADPKAPYHKEHMFALDMEHQMSDALGMNWITYNKEMEEAQQ